jgi:hypothetical protein
MYQCLCGYTGFYQEVEDHVLYTEALGDHGFADVQHV